MKLAAHLAEPATFVALLLLLGCVWTWATVSRGGGLSLRWLWPGVLLVYLGFATPLGGNALLRPLEQAARDAAAGCAGQAGTPALAVVFAGGIEAEAASVADYHVLSEGSLRRTIAAARWARADASRRVLLSGGHGAVAEAELMAKFLVDLGIQASRIGLDSASRNTAQSAAWVARESSRPASARVAVITSADHMPRVLFELHRRRVQTCALPVDFRYVAPIMPGHLVPQLTALSKSTRALHEYLGLLRAGAMFAE